MKVIHTIHPDWLTWTIIATFATFWIEDIIQMRRHGTTLSKLLGWLEGTSILRHCIAGAAIFVLLLHIILFP